MAEADILYKNLKRLVLEDPKEARQEFLRLFEGSDQHLDELLAFAALPGESRIRQTVANALRSHPNKNKLTFHLEKWRNIEVDEFALRAIDAALKDAEPRETGAGKPRNVGSSLQITDMYRYVAERLRHKLRNAMMAAQNHSVEIRRAISRNDSIGMSSHIAKLNDSMLVIGRMLEAADVDPGYFEQKAVKLSAWLSEMNKRYANQYEAIELILSGDLHPEILASDYLLETAFWNIWINAQQAIGSGCKIGVRITISGNRIRVLVVDNGTGFSQLLKGVAFAQEYSSKHPSRGRGLLEIQDAIERLGGGVDLVDTPSGELRIEIRLPIFTNVR